MNPDFLEIINSQVVRGLLLTFVIGLPVFFSDSKILKIVCFVAGVAILVYSFYLEISRTTSAEHQLYLKVARDYACENLEFCEGSELNTIDNPEDYLMEAHAYIDPAWEFINATARQLPDGCETKNMLHQYSHDTGNLLRSLVESKSVLESVEQVRQVRYKIQGFAPDSTSQD